jgi:chymotrypsin
MHSKLGLSENKVERSFATENVPKFSLNLQLSSPLEFNERVQPISLPTEEQDYPAGTACVVSGWGATFSAGVVVPKLRFVGVPAVSDAQCQIYYADQTIADHMLCAGMKYL